MKLRSAFFLGLVSCVTLVGCDDDKSAVRNVLELELKWDELSCSCGGYADFGYDTENECVADQREDLSAPETSAYISCVERAANAYPYARQYFECGYPIWKRSYECQRTALATCDEDALDACRETEETEEERCNPCLGLSGDELDECENGDDPFSQAEDDCDPDE